MQSSISSADKIRNRAAWISAIASVVIFTMKVVAYRLTSSTAVLSDALESIVNVIAAIVALFVIRFAAQPADEDHPYGHGKAEYFSSAFEGGMIFFAAIMIIAEAAKALIYHEPTQKLEMGLLIVGGAALVNLALGLYLKRVGTTHQSDALKASGAHVLSDVLTTAGVMVGLGLVLLTGIQWLDPVIAMLVGLQLAYSGFKIVRESLGGLMDQQDMASLELLASALEKNRVPGVINIHHLRVIRSGRFHHVDAHMVVPEYWDVSQVHAMTSDYEAAVVKDYEFDGELAFHVDPCKKSYCDSCEVPQCPIRLQPFRHRPDFSVKSLTDDPAPTNQGTHDRSGSKKTN
ncbi:cation diffusion facilitator family transporter [Bdellovibrio bacteriovorus]|uniref:cation diffusion facilitator family transporter n=1 Tax=Bdellovibrio bacteriovorus TaxID=959 RepID=UPI003A80256C